MNFSCWASGTWAAGSWVEGSWCPGTSTPTPTTTAEEVHLLEPLYIWDERDALRREEEEVFFIL